MGINSTSAISGDRYFQAYSQIISSKPDSKEALMSLVSDSESLSAPSPAASVYIALLHSIIDHPTGFEKYYLAPSHHLKK